MGKNRVAAVLILAAMSLESAALADRTPIVNGQVGSPNTDNPAILLDPDPMSMVLYQLPAGTDWASVTDVEVADFSGDGRLDLAVLWCATDFEAPTTNKRVLTLLRNEGDQTFTRLPDINLFVYNTFIEQLSIFRNGTSELAVGDFDGDGDIDLAAAAFFGDEIYLIENLGNSTFVKYQRFPFGFNSTGNLITPPRMLAADFDGDGRDDLVYVSDPQLSIGGQTIHFWRTSTSVAAMSRVFWEGLNTPECDDANGDGEPDDPSKCLQFAYWVRSLAIGDFDGDQRPDLAFCGARDANEQFGLIVLWYGLNLASGEFTVRNLFPSFVASDIVPASLTHDCAPGIVLTDADGTRTEYWTTFCDQALGFDLVRQIDGYAGLSPGIGMAEESTDIDGDGDLDIVTKQKVGDIIDTGQVEVSQVSRDGKRWLVSQPVNTGGIATILPVHPVLRPRNLVTADLFGNTLPEIIVGSGNSPPPGEPAAGSGLEVLQVVVWRNSLIGDANRDGVVDLADLALVWLALDTCAGDAGFRPDADFDKSSCVDSHDVELLFENFGGEVGRWPVPGGSGG